MSNFLYILGFPDVAIVTDRGGATGVAPGIPVDDFTVLSQSLVAGLVTDTDNVLSPSIAAAGGFATLAPALVADADAFYVPAVTPGAVALLPALVSDGDTISAPTVSATAFLSPAPVASDDAFFVPVASNAATLVVALFNDTDTFYAPLLSQFLLPALVADADTVAAPTIALSTQFLTLSVVASDDAVYPAGIALGGNLLPALYTDADSIAAAAVIPGAITLQPAVAIDADAFYAASLSASGGLLSLAPSLLVDSDDVPTPDVGYRLFGQLLVDVDLVDNPHVNTLAHLLPNVFEDRETTFIQNIGGGIPAPPPSGALIGSISYPRRVLHGTINRQLTLTGSIKKPRVLTGSIKR